MADETRRITKKLTAVRRAEFRLKQRLEAIDWELDVLTPEIEDAKNKVAAGIAVDTTLVELEAPDEGKAE